jgi:hypothetical protein
MTERHAASATRESGWPAPRGGTNPDFSPTVRTHDPEADAPKQAKSRALRCIEDLYAHLSKHGDWMPLGSADERKPAADGTVEAWGRGKSNPVKGWYGLKKGLRGRFGMYVPPVLEALGLAEVEHNPKNNRMRAITKKK